MSKISEETTGVIPSKEIDILALLRDGNHFAEKRGNLVYVINALTGRTLAVQQELSPAPLVHVPTPDGDLYIQPGITPQVLNVREILYNPLTVDLICQKIAEGGSLTRICKEPGMPTYTVFNRWRRQNPGIDEQLANARRDRAETMRDEAMGHAEMADEDTLDVSRFRADMKKWAAGVDDAKYSPKAKFEATLNTPTQIIVHTGIDRSRDVEPAPTEQLPGTPIDPLQLESK